MDSRREVSDLVGGLVLKSTDLVKIRNQTNDNSKYNQILVQTFKKSLDLRTSLGNISNTKIDSFPLFTDINFHPRRNPTDSLVFYNNVKIRTREDRIVFRFILNADIRADEWDKPQNIDTFYEKMKEHVTEISNIRIDFLDGGNSWFSTKIIAVTVILTRLPEETLLHAVIRAEKELLIPIIQCDESVNPLAKIENILSIWENKVNLDDEEYWHQILKNNSWIVTHSLSLPEIMFIDKANLGGKGISNSGGKIIDFTFINSLSKNISLIEIKTPNSRLLGSKYRGVYSLSKELSGGIVQIIDYKETIQKNYYNLLRESNEQFEVFSPNMILILGTYSKMNLDQNKYFDLFRRELKNVQIICFDELFNKIELMYKFLSTASK